MRIGLVGCGAMGSALLRGWLNITPQNHTFHVITPDRPTVAPFESDQVIWHETPENLPPLDLLIFALKPNVLPDILPLYRHVKAGLMTSIAAGKRCAFYEQYLGRPVVRIMPNTPVVLNQGVLGIYAPFNLAPDQMLMIESLWGALGQVFWLEDEDLFDGVTALSGSGPAYVFLMIEAMRHAATTVGLPGDMASAMALQTVRGAANYAASSPLDVINLRENVTSPNGTTASALKILMGEGGLTPLMDKAIQEATNRGKELGS